MIKVVVNLHHARTVSKAKLAGCVSVGVAFHPVSGKYSSGKTVKMILRLKSGHLIDKEMPVELAHVIYGSLDRPCYIRLPEHKLRHFMRMYRGYVPSDERLAQHKEIVYSRFAALNFALKNNK